MGKSPVAQTDSAESSLKKAIFQLRNLSGNNIYEG